MEAHDASSKNIAFKTSTDIFDFLPKLAVSLSCHIEKPNKVKVINSNKDFNRLFPILSQLCFAHTGPLRKDDMNRSKLPTYAA